jgi:hypothetical protein
MSAGVIVSAIIYAVMVGILCMSITIELSKTFPTLGNKILESFAFPFITVLYYFVLTTGV